MSRLAYYKEDEEYVWMHKDDHLDDEYRWATPEEIRLYNALRAEAKAVDSRDRSSIG